MIRLLNIMKVLPIYLLNFELVERRYENEKEKL